MLDKTLMESIAEVVAEEGQPVSVANRLIAWLTEMSNAELGRDDNSRFLGNVLQAIVEEDDYED